MEKEKQGFLEHFRAEMLLGGCTLPLVFHRFSVILLHHGSGSSHVVLLHIWAMLQILISLFP